MKEAVEKLIKEYLEAPEAWSDNVMIEVDPVSKDVRLNDDEEADIENSDMDFWPVMDLLRMSVETPGAWEIDPDAIAELITSY